MRRRPHREGTSPTRALPPSSRGARGLHRTLVGSSHILEKSRPFRRMPLMPYPHAKVPAGDKISIANSKLRVPDRPVVPFIEGDGTGPDIWRASVRVFDAAVQKAYGGKRKIAWMEVYAGQKSFDKLNTWLPDETVD